MRKRKCHRVPMVCGLDFFFTFLLLTKYNNMYLNQESIFHIKKKKCTTTKNRTTTKKTRGK